MLGLFIAQVLNGLLDGTYYLLIALGLSLIFSLGGIINLAHGAFFAIGAYLAILITPYVGYFGALIIVPFMVAGLGMLTERTLFTRFYRIDPLYSLLLTFGLAMVIEQGLRWIFGASPQNYNMPDILRGQVFMGDFIYSRYRLFLIAVAVAVVAALWVLLNRTSFGRIVLRASPGCCCRRSIPSIRPWGPRLSRWPLSWS
jgi:branched-chain amino acid transport system permease protein